MNRNDLPACLDTLVAAATNRKATAAQRDTADRALKNLAEDFRTQGFPESRAAVEQAIALVASKRALAARMGVGFSEPMVRREGRSVIFPALGLAAKR